MSIVGSRATVCCLLVIVAIASTACNKSDKHQDSHSAAADGGSNAQQAGHESESDASEHASQVNYESADATRQTVPPPSATTPGEAVKNFLDAVRRGDDGQAEALLSEVAREKTREMDLAVAPPGSPTANFEVGETEYPYEGADSAHVASQWSDVDGTGEERTEEIVWILRKQPRGWRIAGMATKLFDDQPPLILNFEDPQDMIRKQEAAEREIRRRKAEAETATRGPQTSG